MNIPQATHSGELEIGGMIFPCSVLSDGTRILTQTDFMDVMDMYYSGSASKKRPAHMPVFLALEPLYPFINKHLKDLRITIKYRTKKGQIAHGIKASIIPGICDVWMDAEEAGSLTKRQQQTAKKAKTLIRGLAHIGIIALVDEATGYEKIRKRGELNEALDRYLRPFEARWAKRFPDEFYEEIYRIKGWEWEGMQTNRFQVVGHFTNDIIYARMEDYLLDHLRQINPKDEEGERKNKHHQWLTDDFGVQELREHIVGVLAIMRSVQDFNPERAWAEFQRRLQRSFPKKNTNYDFDFDE